MLSRNPLGSSWPPGRLGRGLVGVSEAAWPLGERSPPSRGHGSPPASASEEEEEEKAAWGRAVAPRWENQVRRSE